MENAILPYFEIKFIHLSLVRILLTIVVLAFCLESLYNVVREAAWSARQRRIAI